MKTIPRVETDDSEEGFSQALNYSFENIINIDDVVSIIIGDVTIPMSTVR